MPHLIYVTHPQVTIDPAVPVPDWGLSEQGRLRAMAACRQPWLRDVETIIASAERKAIETAEILAGARGLTVEVRSGLHENGRSATGYLAAPEFERLADAFFANPNLSARGWERALDAQARISAHAEQIPRDRRGTVCLVGHGGVGTLLYCHLAGLPVDRRYDQPVGGGCYFTFDIEARQVIHGWRFFDRIDGHTNDARSP